MNPNIEAIDTELKYCRISLKDLQRELDKQPNNWCNDALELQAEIKQVRKRLEQLWDRRKELAQRTLF